VPVTEPCDQPRQSRPSPALLIAVFAVSMSVLGFEVSLTRAFSVLLRFHFVFLAVSIATCGTGLGGLVDFLLRRGPLRKASPPVVLVLTGSLSALLMPLTFLLLFASPLSAKLTSVWVVTALCLPSFLAAGAFLSHAFAWFSAQGGRLYFADLTGAALGSFLVIGALQLFGGINAGILWGAAIALGMIALCFLLDPGRRAALAWLPVCLVLAVGGLLVANRSGAVVSLPVLPLTDDPNAKPLYQELGDPKIGAKIVDTEWNAFARTDVVSNRGVEELYVYTDGEVPTNMLHFNGDLQAVLPRLQEFIGYYAFQELKPDKVMLIGPGGGLDILLSLAVNAKQIDGAELNPSIPRLVRKYGELTGHVYDLEGVNIRVDEGRSFISRSRQRYDLIYMALTKTATTTSSSLALLESYIHTTEAFEQMLRHLSDRGAIAFVSEHPLILMRAMLTAVRALETLGTPRQEALAHCCLLSVQPEYMAFGPYRYMMIVGRQAISPERSRQLAADCIGMHLVPVYFPGAFEPEPFPQLTRKGMSDAQFVDWWNQWQGYEGRQRLDFRPCTDDRPFVVDMSVGIPPQFTRFLWAVLLLAALLTVCVTVWMRRTAPESYPGVGPLGGSALYFSLLGVGFMLVEVVLTQRLVLYLGYPVLTLSVILFSLLLGGGLGSLWSQSWQAGAGLARRAAVAALVVAVGALLVYKLQPVIVASTLAWDLRLRCAVTMALLIPLGFAMGTPFPTGIRVVGAWSADLVPWMWGLNGVNSVVGSVAAMSLAKLYGFGSVFMVGIVVYALAAVVALMLSKSRAVSEAEAVAAEA
jgi:hypothetical protein